MIRKVLLIIALCVGVYMAFSFNKAMEKDKAYTECMTAKAIEICKKHNVSVLKVNVWQPHVVCNTTGRWLGNYTHIFTIEEIESCNLTT